MQERNQDITISIASNIYIAPISTDNYLGSVILLPSISIAPIWIASVWDDTGHTHRL